jgi:ubiquinone/menaquinone biosynthesis C-methylase UbiE
LAHIDSRAGASGEEGLIDASKLAASYTVEELASKADELVRSMEDPTALLAKPCSSLREAPDLLTCFGMLLAGIAPLPGMVVLDFGAGSCWTTHLLAQLGCRVVAMDVSQAMLDLGRRRFAWQPLFGERPEPKFVHFDGRSMELDDESVDRILCFDALHHVPNVAEVLSEMGRVLRPGAVAGFSEPGPRHSRDPQSQHEMRRYGVPELDLVVEDIWKWSQEAGFVELSVAEFSPVPQWVPLETFSQFLAGADGAALSPRIPRAVRGAMRIARELRRPGPARASFAYLSHVRGVLENRRMFLLRKAGTEPIDSREVSGLAADLEVEDVRLDHTDGNVVVSGRCTITNVGRNVWLPSSAGQGAVLLGLRLGRGSHPAADHGRVPLPGDSSVVPGSTVKVTFATQVPEPASGEEPFRLELDLVSEGIAWFAEVRGRPVEILVGPPR